MNLIFPASLGLISSVVGFAPPPQKVFPGSLSMTEEMEDATAAQAQRMRDKAAQLRAEIAALEGKSVQEVEQEAEEKKKRLERVAAEAEESRQRNKKESPVDWGRMLEVPVTRDDMIAQASGAIERAYRDGHMKRQTVRLALVKEDQGFIELNQWPGGAQQMYREAAKPITRELMSRLRVSPDQLLPPKVKDQDIWDFDGSALFSSEAQEGPEFDVQALVFPNTDVKYINDIGTIDETMGDRLFLLVNPFWRNLDSWGIDILAPGAKKKAEETIFKKGYDETYVFLRFSARGEECVAIKAYPYHWQIFAYLEDDMGYQTPVRLGSSETEPKSERVTELLNSRPEFKLSKMMRQMNR